jgi:hypothetical protein
VQVDRDVEPFATQSSCEREIVEQPSGTAPAFGDDDLVEMTITANDCSR